MEILNIGPLELIFIILIAFVVLGPEEAIRLARKAGSLFYRVTRSPIWSSLINTSKDIRELPRKLAKEIEIEEAMKEINNNLQEISGDVGRGEKVVLASEKDHLSAGDEKEISANESPK
jgi:Sec-independent protein translocase protein TatA